MNTYYNLIQYIKETFEEDNRVNNVITGHFEQWARDMFSIVHLDVTDSPYSADNTANVRFNVVINVLDIRDVNKEDHKDRFWFNDNRHDIWNETLSILNLARNKFVKEHKQNNITVFDASLAERITYQYMSGLDGWQQTITFDVPDIYTAIC